MIPPMTATQTNMYAKFGETATDLSDKSLVPLAGLTAYSIFHMAFPKIENRLKDMGEWVPTTIWWLSPVSFSAAGMAGNLPLKTNLLITGTLFASQVAISKLTSSTRVLDSTPSSEDSEFEAGETPTPRELTSETPEPNYSQPETQLTPATSPRARGERTPPSSKASSRSSTPGGFDWLTESDPATPPKRRGELTPSSRTPSRPSTPSGGFDWFSESAPATPPRK